MSQTGAASPPKETRFGELDGLRGIAAFIVLLFHLSYFYDPHRLAPFAVPWGHYGVELFFIISGFVIFMTLERGGGSRAFIASRIARLYPAYWAAVILTALVAFALETNPAFLALLAAINLTMLQAFLSVPPIDNSYWTLALEGEFYVLIGLLAASGQLRRIDAWCLAVLALGFAANALHMTGLFAWPSAVPLLFLDYANFFVIGISLYRFGTGRGTRLTRATLALAILYAGQGGGKFSLDPSGFIYLPVACAWTIIVWWAVTGRLPFLRTRFLLWLGGISYPLYLVHQRIGTDVMEAVWRAGLPGWAAFTAAVLIVVTLAAAIERWIDRPFRPRLRRALS